jgi:hypothetical protein
MRKSILGLVACVLLLLTAMGTVTAAPQVIVTGKCVQAWGDGPTTNNVYYRFTAQIDKNGVAKGHFTAQCPAYHEYYQGKVDDLYVNFEGNTAWIAGVVKRSHDPSVIGKDFWVVVEDNGDYGDYVYPVSIGWILGEDPVNAPLMNTMPYLGDLMYVAGSTNGIEIHVF